MSRNQINTWNQYLGVVRADELMCGHGRLISAKAYVSGCFLTGFGRADTRHALRLLVKADRQERERANWARKNGIERDPLPGYHIGPSMARWAMSDSPTPPPGATAASW